MTSLLKFPESIPLSLYLHLPWCVRKCPYCDFNSHELPGKKVQDLHYVECLVSDLEYELPNIWGRKVSSVFIGGGTPSLFSAEAINKLISELRARLNLHPEIEITMEANPGTVEATKFSEFRKAGINRLSLGIQSLDNDQLKKLGRIHDSTEAIEAFHIAREAGFDNINLDLMFGLPGQTVNQALSDLESAVSMQPEHISWYQLTIEPNTVFYSKPPVLPEEDDIWMMQIQGQQLLDSNGYQQYEVSAYSRNKPCLHNMNYWEFGDYLGLGAGAHGKLTDFAEKRIIRYARHRVPNKYIKLAGNAEVITHRRILDKAEHPLEFMMNALRLNNGFNTRLFEERTGLPLFTISKELETAEQKEMIKYDINKLTPTEKGRRFLNDLLQIFMQDKSN